MSKEGGDPEELSMLGSREERGRRGWCWMGQGCHKVKDGGSYAVSGGGGGHGDSGGEPGKSVGSAFGTSFPDPDVVTAVVVQSGADVPTVNSMWCPGATDSGRFVDKNSGARRSKGCTVIVEGTMELGIGRELGIDAGSAEKIQGDEGLGKEAVPKM